MVFPPSLLHVFITCIWKTWIKRSQIIFSQSLADFLPSTSTRGVPSPHTLYSEAVRRAFLVQVAPRSARSSVSLPLPLEEAARQMPLTGRAKVPPDGSLARRREGAGSTDRPAVLQEVSVSRADRVATEADFGTLEIKQTGING